MDPWTTLHARSHPGGEEDTSPPESVNFYTESLFMYCFFDVVNDDWHQCKPNRMYRPGSRRYFNNSRSTHCRRLFCWRFLFANSCCRPSFLLQFSSTWSLLPSSVIIKWRHVDEISVCILPLGRSPARYSLLFTSGVRPVAEPISGPRLWSPAGILARGSKVNLLHFLAISSPLSPFLSSFPLPFPLALSTLPFLFCAAKRIP